MKLKIAQVIGLNTDQKAAQVISSVREDENAFLAVLELSCDDAFTKGRQALSELEDYFFETDGSVADKLNATFAEAEKKLSEGASFDLALGAISGKILYLIGRGEVEVYLKRDDKLSALLSVGSPSQVISGFLVEGDLLLLSTKTLVSFLGTDLEKSLSLPLDTFEEEVSNKIGASELEDQGLAALLVKIDQEEEEIPPLPSEGLDQKEKHQEYTTPTSEIFSESKMRLVLKVVKIIKDKLLVLFRKIQIYFPKSGRGRLAVAILLIIIIAAGVGLKYKSSKDRQKQTQFNQMLQKSKDDFNAAKGLVTLNPTEAKNKLGNAKDEVGKALVIKPKDSEAQALKKQIEEDSPSILQQSSVSDFPLFLDMDLVKKNFRATQMSLSSGKLLLLDPAVKTLVVIDIAKKSNQILAGSEQLGEATFSSLNGGLAFIYSKDKGILRVDTVSQKLTTISKKDSDFGDIKDIYGFSGNVYLLDSGKNKIWKYLPTSDGYSEKREYLTVETKVDLSNALRMQIESSVYILKKDGEMIRFTKGAKDNFSYGGLPSGIKDPKSFFVSSDTDNLYILDSGNSRLLILTKTGEYKGTMIGDKFSSVTDLVVDEKSKKAYLLDGSKIYLLDLK